MGQKHDLKSLLEEYDLNPNKICIPHEKVLLDHYHGTFNVNELESQLHIAQHSQIEIDYWEDVKNTLIEKIDTLPINEPKWTQALKDFFFL